MSMESVTSFGAVTGMVLALKNFYLLRNNAYSGPVKLPQQWGRPGSQALPHGA